VQVGCGDDEGRWAQSRTLYNTGFHRCNRRAFPGISRTVKVLLKERLYPAVDIVWDIQLRHLVHQSLIMTVSNAFVKSNEKTWTYWLVDNIVRTV